MKDFFLGLTNVARALVEVYEPRIRRLVTQMMNRMSEILRIALIWPFLLVGVAMICPPHVAHTLIPILTLAPLVLLLWLATTWPAIAGLVVIGTVPATARFKIGKVVSLLRVALKRLLLILLAELTIGVYLALVPVSADPGLVPLLILVAISLGLAVAVTHKKWLRIILILLIIGITGIFFRGGRNKVAGEIEKRAELMNADRQPLANYHKIICDDAWQNEFYAPAGNHFTVKLHEGCFGGFVHLPKGWRDWHYQPVGNDQGWWFSPWFEGSPEPEGLYNRVARPYFAFHPTAFRLQGKEGQEILFYTNDAEMKPASPLTTQRQTGIVPPELLSRVEPAYTEEARDANFSGKVPVNIVIDENGKATNVEIVNPPGFGLEANILAAVKQWRWQPATKDGVPIALRATITTQFQID